jgi:hypothetical protein
MSIPKKIFAPIQVWSVVLGNGVITIKSALMLKNPSSTSRTTSVLLDKKTLHADLLLAGIAQLVTVMVADKCISTSTFEV